LSGSRNHGDNELTDAAAGFGPAPALANTLPFASTGPQGHRARMRTKLLQVGPTAFADYELLEMLLFLGIGRRDTKPLAKGTINRFGSLAATLAAPPAELAQALSLGGGDPTDSVAALKLVEEAAARLSRAETQERPVLGNQASLTAYLDSTFTAPAPKTRQLRVLFLNNRNRLLADEVHATEGPAVTRARARRACDRADPGADPGPESQAACRRRRPRPRPAAGRERAVDHAA
jgi:DNA repair protein RadC